MKSSGPHKDPLSRFDAGMSLVELLIVISIVAILAMIGGPSFSQFIQEKRRVDAHQLLLENASRLQRCLTLAGAYNGGCNLIAESKDGYYTLNPTLTTQTWTLAAVPTAGGAQENDARCMSIVLDHTGNRTATGTTPGNCW